MKSEVVVGGKERKTAARVFLLFGDSPFDFRILPCSRCRTKGESMIPTGGKVRKLMAFQPSDDCMTPEADEEEEKERENKGKASSKTKFPFIFSLSFSSTSAVAFHSSLLVSAIFRQRLGSPGDEQRAGRSKETVQKVERRVSLSFLSNHYLHFTLHLHSFSHPPKPKTSLASIWTPSLPSSLLSSLPPLRPPPLPSRRRSSPAEYRSPSAPSPKHTLHHSFFPSHLLPFFIRIAEIADSSSLSHRTFDGRRTWVLRPD